MRVMLTRRPAVLSEVGRPAGSSALHTGSATV